MTRTLWALSASLLVGCAGVSPLPPADATGAQAAIPAAWHHAGPNQAPAGVSAQAQTSPEELARWWRVFDDPLMSDWVTQALAANPGLQETRAALQQARALRAVTVATGGVGVRASGSGARTLKDSAASNRLDVGLDASWEWDLFGGQRAAEAGADAEVAAAAATLGQAQVSLAAEVALTVLEWRSAEARLRLAQDSLSRLQDTLALTEWRLQAGLVSSLELAQAQTSLAQAQAALPALQTSRTQALHALAVLTGQPPAALMATAVPAAGQPVPLPAAQLALRLPSDTLRQRPDVQVAEQRLRAAWAQALRTRADRLPRFTFSGSLGLSSPRLTDLFDAAALTRSVLASVAATLYDHGAGEAREQAQHAVLQQAQLRLQDTVLQALQEVENVLVSLQGQRQRLQALQAAQAAAITTETLSRQRYTAGLTDVRTVLEAERSRLATETDLITTQAAWSSDHVRLAKALGGGWTPEP